MSTNIHHGLILRKATLAQGLERLKNVRQQVLPEAQAALATAIAKDMAFSLDMAHNYCAMKEEEKGFWAVVGQIKKAKVKVLGEGYRDTDWDYSFEVCLIPKGRDLLALFYIEKNPGYVDALKAAGFEDYHYQNSTDRPDTICARDWSQRTRDWNKALPGATSPNQVGMTYTVVSWRDIEKVVYERELVTASVPSDDQRRKAVAMHLTDIEVAENHPKLRLRDQAQMTIELEPDRRPSVTLAPAPFG